MKSSPQKLLPSDRTALAKERLRKKMEERNQKQSAEQAQNDDVDEDAASSCSSSSASSTTSSETGLKNKVHTSQLNGGDDDDGDDDDASPISTTSPPGPVNEEELEVLDKFFVAHRSTSFERSFSSAADDAAADSKAAAAKPVEPETVPTSSLPSAKTQQEEEKEETPATSTTKQEEQLQQEEEAEDDAPEFEEYGTLLSEQNKSDKFTPQHFDYFLLLDFECTCDDGQGFHNEIIEIPCLLYETKTLKVVDTYHTYVRPLRNPTLTPFCTQLTGIRQEQVQSAPCYDEALREIVAWTEETLFKQCGSRATDGKRLCVATDGPCDLEVFAYLMMHKRDGFAFPSMFHRYIDVKQTFRDEYGQGKYFKIKDMLAHFGLRFRGHQHSGIDDTKNLARIVSKMIFCGTTFSNVYHVTHKSGRCRVPAYLWSKAQQSVSTVRRHKTEGVGPMMAAKVRTGRSAGELMSEGGMSLVSLLFKRVQVRAGEYSTAPSNNLLVILLCVFIATFFAGSSS